MALLCPSSPPEKQKNKGGRWPLQHWQALSFQQVGAVGREGAGATPNELGYFLQQPCKENSGKEGKKEKDKVVVQVGLL